MKTLATLTLQERAVKMIKFKGWYSYREFSYENRLKPRHSHKEMTLYMR